jgi:aryl-alcohol dehydrogenase-like predicted oxidoreductase
MYLIHQPKPDEQIEEGWTTLNELKQEGLVRYVGVSNFDLEQLRRAQSIAPVDLVEPRYSLLDRQIEKNLLPYCEEQAIGILAYSPMGSGLLTGRMSAERVASLSDDDWRKQHPDFREPTLSRNLAVAERLAELGQRWQRSSGAMACAWVLADPHITSAIVGFRGPEQVRGVLGDDRFALSDADFSSIRAEVGL